MKRYILGLFFFTALCCGNEIGLILGEPTGISYRHIAGSTTAIDFAVGWSFRSSRNDDGDNVDIHKKSDMRIEGYRLPWYFGPGGRVKFGEDKVVIGVKAPFGVYYKFRDIPFSMFFELAPGLNLTPSTEFDITGGLGFRYIFGGSASTDEAPADDTPRERR
jgi:hypothetical protein